MSNSPRRKTDAALRRIDVLLKGIVRVFNAAAVVALLAIVAVVLYQIFARYALPKSPVWTEELSRYLFAYAIVFASGAVLVRKRHVSLELFHHKLSERTQWAWALGLHLLIAVFALLLLPHAWAYAANGHRQTSPALGVKLTWVFASTVVFFALVSVVSLLLAARDALRLLGGGKASVEITILLVLFVVLLFAGVPIAFSLGISSVVYLLLVDIPLTIVPQRFFGGMDSFVLLCIPGFILAGNLMNAGNITHHIIRFSDALFGHVRGGLGLANVGGSMIFGGISGTAIADTTSIGAVMIPGMAKHGYDKPFAAAVTAASSTVGPIIPPSVPMIIVGSLTSISVGKMFIAGALPGLLLGGGMMITTYVLAVYRKYPKGKKFSLLRVFKEGRGAIWALLLTVVILYGILGGVFTPTEASIVASLYALIVGLFVYKTLTVKQLPRILLDTVVSTAALMTLVGMANVFAWILASENIPQLLANGILSITDNPLLVILFINLLLLFVGSFMETIAALIILFPALLGVAEKVGMDPVHFGVMAVLNLMIGLTTPPVGVCLFVAAEIGETPLQKVVKAIWPYLLCNVLVLGLVAYVPAISLWLPGLLD